MPWCMYAEAKIYTHRVATHNFITNIYVRYHVYIVTYNWQCRDVWKGNKIDKCEILGMYM